LVLAGEGPARIVANFDRLSGGGFENQPVGRESDMAIGHAEPAERCSLLMDIGLIDRVREQACLPFEVQEQAADRQFN
jgi:hypothetical protein